MRGRVQCEVVETRYGAMHVPTEDTVIGRSLRIYGEWAEAEISLMASLLNPVDTILDVGANIGTHTLAFSKLLPCCPIVSFEPQLRIFEILVANILLNRLDKVTPIPFALSSRSSIVDVAASPSSDNLGEYSVERALCGYGKGMPIMNIPIDRVALTARIQLMKIDVEGAEAEVILGAKQTIERDRPIIFAEVLSIASAQDIRRSLRGSGYLLYWAETSQFNENNFRNYPTNIWGRHEHAILALPPERNPPEGLERVTGDEVDIPA